MAETLLSASGVLLYGRVLEDLQFTFVGPATQGPNAPAAPPPRLGGNSFLQNQLAAGRDEQGNLDPERAPQLARIYGFSYEGRYYDLPKPVVFLVHGPGTDPEEPRLGPDLPLSRSPRAPADADHTGTARQYESFAEDIRVWAYDKADYSIRLDVETGPFERILLEALLGPDSLGGAKAGLGGAKAGVGGAKAGLSGAKASLGGAKVGRDYGDY